jgi:NAD-dependent SIR2 family protein deacetylase
MSEEQETIQRAAEAIRVAEALLVTAGAGMGVDSGLPDFRGNEGFWNAYPPYRSLGLSFVELAKPRWFRKDPTLAWGFYGHRLELYRRTRPHAGFDVLRSWMQAKPLGGFVFTSNVDGQFQRAGFDRTRILECHGALDWMQCTRACGAGLFPSAPWSVDVDPASFRAKDPLPSCPACGELARPNVLMWDDGGWDSTRTEEQDARLGAWLEEVRGARLVVVECGAGTALPTVREFGEEMARRAKSRLVRINAREHEVPSGELGIGMGARAALEAIDAALQGG